MDEKKQFTIDEWFYHWLADETQYLEAFRLFLKIYDVCDKIVLQKDTRLGRKFFRLDFESGKYAPQHRSAIRLIKNLFLANSLKIYWVENIEDLNEEIEACLPRKDVYLVKICAQTRDKFLITTDHGLHESLVQCFQTLGIKPIFAEQFIEEYLKLS